MYRCEKCSVQSCTRCSEKNDDSISNHAFNVIVSVSEIEEIKTLMKGTAKESKKVEKESVKRQRRVFDRQGKEDDIGSGIGTTTTEQIIETSRKQEKSDTRGPDGYEDTSEPYSAPGLCSHGFPHMQ